MKVIEVGREKSLARIADDPRVGQIVDLVRRNDEMLGLALTVIRSYLTYESLTLGPQGGGGSFRQVINMQTRKGGRTSRRLGDELASAIEGLYRDEDEGRVRGTLLEALVEDRLRSRYASADCLLTNNLLFRLEDRGVVVYSSKKNSIDVIGFDGREGECHDCKVNAKGFKKVWIEELENDVAPHGFKIGLATASYADEARRHLLKLNIRLRTAQLLDAKQIFKLTPLQPPPRIS